MLKTAASKMALAIRTACVVLVLAVVLVGCSGADAGSGTQEEQAKAAPPKAEDDHATTSEGREVTIEMVANDSGKEEFPYGVKDASGKTDSAMVYVTVKPAE